MATAVLLTDAEHAPRYRYVNGDLVGCTQVWRVDTDDEVTAVAATGLPRYGDALSVSDPGLKVREHAPRFEGGTYTLVEVYYERPGAGGSGGSRPRPEPNLAYTEREYTLTTVTVKYALSNLSVGTGTSHDPDLPIAGGEGAPKEVVATLLKVVIWRAPQDYSPDDDISLEDMQSHVAANELRLPPLYGTLVPLVYRPRKLRYLYTEVRGESGLVRIEHRFEARNDHLFHWRSENDKGVATGPEHTSAIYQVSDFPQSALS